MVDAGSEGVSEELIAAWFTEVITPDWTAEE